MDPAKRTAAVAVLALFALGGAVFHWGGSRERHERPPAAEVRAAPAPSAVPSATPPQQSERPPPEPNAPPVRRVPQVRGVPAEAPLQPPAEVAAVEEWSLGSWPDEMPSILRPPAFRKQVEAAMQKCATPMTLIDVDCTGPPCYAVFAVSRGEPPGISDNKVLMDFSERCATWHESYGMSVDRYTRASRSVSCRDGHQVWVLLLGSDEAFEPLGVDRPERFSILKADQQARIDTAVAQYDVCAL